MSAIAEKVEVLKRSEAIDVSQDPTGKRWVIKSQRGKSLLKVQVEPFHSVTKVPAVFAGEWTSRNMLQGAINEWLKQQWDKCDIKVAHEAKPLASIGNTTKTDHNVADESAIRAAVKAENDAIAATKRTPTEVAQERVNKNAGSTNK